MANVAVTIPMLPVYRPFERPSDPAALWTAIPRGLRGFILRLTTLDAKPVNDTETFSLTGTLGPGFAYVFAEISIRLTQDRAADWRSTYRLNLQNFFQGLQAFSQSWLFDFGVVGLGSDERVNGPNAPGPLPRSPMWSPKNSDGVLIDINGSNPNPTVAAAGTLSCYINFWEFDLEQIRKFPINTPFPVHLR